MSAARVALLTVLVGALVVTTSALWSQTGATAPSAPGHRPYQILSGQVSGDFEAVYVLDNETRRLAVLKYDRPKDQLVPIAGRDLQKDFAGKEPGEFSMTTVQLRSNLGLLYVTDYTAHRAIAYKVDLIAGTILPNTPLDLDALFKP